MLRWHHLFRIMILSLLVSFFFAACAPAQESAVSPDQDSESDCSLVQRAANRASQASEQAIAQDQSVKARAQADQELFETNPKKYWRQKREEAIARGVDPEEAQRRYNMNAPAPINLGRYSDSQAAGDRAWVETFTNEAAALWPKVDEPDLKFALRELSQGENQAANYTAITSICNM